MEDLGLTNLFGQAYAGRRVLVTGHTGFKGSWLALWLRSLGARVCGLALPAATSPSHHALLGTRVEEDLIDLRDAAAVAAAMRRFEPEVVFHLAAQPLVRRSYRASFLAAGEGGRVVALATARAGNVIGGGDWSEDRLIPDLVQAAAAGRASEIRNPHATRPWQHVLEPLAGYLMLGQQLLADPVACAQAWNFGPDAAGHATVGEVVRAFGEHWPEVRQVIDDASHPHEAAQLHLDCTRAREQLGWRSVWDLAKTLERTARWYRSQHENGGVTSADDLALYVADARVARLAWAT